MSLSSNDKPGSRHSRSEEHTSELQSQSNLVCRLLLEKKKKNIKILEHRTKLAHLLVLLCTLLLLRSSTNYHRLYTANIHRRHLRRVISLCATYVAIR